MAREDWLGTDYYAVLGVDRTADHHAIAHAYRLLARECHPDLHPGDAAAVERFKRITAAYDVVGDAGQRADYDRFSVAARPQASPRRAAVPDWDTDPLAHTRRRPPPPPRILWPTDLPPMEDLVDHRPVVRTRRILGVVIGVVIVALIVLPRYFVLSLY